MAAETTFQVWRQIRSVKAAAAAMVALWIAMAVAFSITQSAFVAVATWIVAGFLLAAAWRCVFTPYVAVTKNGILVQNAFRSREVVWSDVKAIVPTPAGLAIRKESGGWPVLAWAVWKPRWAVWTHHKNRADAIAAELMSCAESMTVEKPCPG